MQIKAQISWLIIIGMEHEKRLDHIYIYKEKKRLNWEERERVVRAEGEIKERVKSAGGGGGGGGGEGSSTRTVALDYAAIVSVNHEPGQCRT